MKRRGKTMTRILCATRGGEASRRTQGQAIALAQAQHAELIFLYVFDLDFMKRVQADSIPDIANEMERMGEFLLAMAREQASERGVEAWTICRQGNTRTEIKAVAVEEEVDVVVLGQPSGTTGRDFFAAEALRCFAEEIEAETGARVMLV
jgi:nucleotide-binding universal stress UspA family protein